jgi:hypothetical protein
MISWLLIGLMVFVLVGVLWYRQRVEGFDADVPTLTAQRQLLQMEGERRFNPLASVQAPLNIVSADQVQAAVQQVVPVPTTAAQSLLSLLGITQMGAADDGTNKQGAGVEQTGMVQEKINFCESLKSLDCEQLDDSRLAECGICLDGGKDSQGNFHRGGMYISADDQIRANEASNATGAPAVYQPTIGTCPPKNFVLMRKNCDVRKSQIKCLKAGAATSTNECGQCYAATPGGYQGLLYVGKKPRSFTANLNVSHPGGHSYNGAGTVVSYTDTNGTAQSLTIPYSNNPLLDPQVLPLTNVNEGTQLSIAVYGAPMIWCAWLSDPATGQRTVSLDIGITAIAPANGYEVAGDKNSGPVATATAEYNSDVWATYKPSVPNTVLFFQRRSETMGGMITAAWYGNTVPQSANAMGNWVTDQVKGNAGSNTAVAVSNDTFGGDPSPGTVKHLWLWFDSGAGPITQEGNTLPASAIAQSLTISATVPASLVPPSYADDVAGCPTGPMVLTEIGAGLMGSHSCFKPDGSFNPTPYCLQELFQAAGGTQQGSAWPATQDAATALVQMDPTTGKPSIDATTAFLNNLGSVATYGVTTTGQPVDFNTFKSASMQMLGTQPLNPCDGPAATTGPQSPECLDYLYRTSGNPGQDASPVDPTSLPYAYCGPAGTMAPLNPDGSVNQQAAAAANANGSVTNIRQFYQKFFTDTQSSDFTTQAGAMSSCFGTTIPAPTEAPSACPSANPDDWQCMTPAQFGQQEVFAVCPVPRVPFSQAEAVCAQYGARLATPDEVTAAQAAGAQWCGCGWTTDGNAYFPMQQNIPTNPGCGGPGVQNCGPNAANAQSLGCVTCVGVKPSSDPTGVIQQWSSATGLSGSPDPNGAWNNPAATYGMASPTSVPAIRQTPTASANGIKQQCASQDGQSCYGFPSADACAAWTQNQSSMTLNPIPFAFPTGWQNGRLVTNTDTDQIFFNRNGSNILNYVSTCVPCSDGYNVCNPGAIAQSFNSATQAQNYVVGPDFVCGDANFIDQSMMARD